MKALAIAPVNQAALDRLVKEGPAWSDYADVDAVLEAAPTAQTVPAESDTYLTLPEWLEPVGEVQGELTTDPDPTCSTSHPDSSSP